MVLGVPLAKFVPELFKAVSKPFVNVLKRNVPKSPFWKDDVFVPLAKLIMVLGVSLAKLLTLAVKVVTKPFVDYLRRHVRTSRFWKNSVFIPMAVYYNKQSVRVRLWAQGIRRNKEQIEKSSQMSEEAALELGAEIVANTAAFAVGLIAILIQQSIAAQTERQKAHDEENNLERVEKNQLELHRKILDLGLELQKHDAQIRELSRTILSFPEYGKKLPNSSAVKTNSTSAQLEEKT